jgi:hypothetical protein
LPSSITVYAAFAVNPTVDTKMSPVVFAALFINGHCPSVVRFQYPDPVSVAATVFDDAPFQRIVTLGDIVELVPDATDQNNFVIVNLCVELSPLVAIKELAVIFLTLVSPVPSEMFVSFTAHAEAWSFNTCVVTASAILFYL